MNLLILFNNLVRAAGLEPARAKAQRILSPLRLPISPRPHQPEPTRGGNTVQAVAQASSCGVPPWRIIMSFNSITAASRVAASVQRVTMAVPNVPLREKG